MWGRPITASGFAILQLLHGDLEALFPEPLQNLLVALLTLFRRPALIFLQRRGIFVQEIAQHMDFLALIVRGKLNTGDDGHAHQFPRLARFYNAVHGVMVGDGNGLESLHSRQRNHVLRAHGAVGGGGVYVHINFIHTIQPFWKNRCVWDASPRLLGGSSLVCRFQHAVRFGERIHGLPAAVGR